jgi:hypothetical protein
MKKTWLWIVPLAFGLGLCPKCLPAEELHAGEAALFLQGGKMVIGQIADFSRTRLVFTLRDGQEIAVHRVWMINFVNTDWNFPAERERMEEDQHYLFFRNDRMTSGKIVDFSHNRGFEFDTKEAVPMGQVRRIYFTNQLPNEYQSRLAEEEAKQKNYVGTFRGDTPLSAAGVRKVTLVLNEDKTVLLTQEYAPGRVPVTEQGTWSDNPDGTITVRTSRPGRIRRLTVEPLIFRLEEDELVAVQFDQAIWGSAGLRLKRT